MQQKFEDYDPDGVAVSGEGWSLAVKELWGHVSVWSAQEVLFILTSIEVKSTQLSSHTLNRYCSKVEGALMVNFQQNTCWFDIPVPKEKSQFNVVHSAWHKPAIFNNE